jgi:hypothetical protein
MSETAMKNQDNVVAETTKPYTFRKFTSVDVFPMFKVLGKIGLNEFTKCFENEGIKDIISKSNNSSADVVGLSVFLEAANVILGNLPKCEQEIYQILSQTSNLSVEQIKDLEMAVFFEMVVDFIKKDDFKDFFKVVSKLFK